jgi:uncharacterized protein YjbJ (UPF0337 family)
MKATGSTPRPDERASAWLSLKGSPPRRDAVDCTFRRNRRRHGAFPSARADNLAPTMRGSTRMVNKDQVKGAARQVSGSVKEAAGKMAGSSKTEAKGKVEKAAGKVQKAYGDAKQDVKDALRR